MFGSFATMVVGLGWWLAGGAPSSPGNVAPAIPLERTLPELFSGNPLALLNLGVLALLATPGITVVVIVVSYLLDRNRRFAALAALVLAILLLSLALSLKWFRLF